MCVLVGQLHSCRSESLCFPQSFHQMDQTRFLCSLEDLHTINMPKLYVKVLMYAHCYLYIMLTNWRVCLKISLVWVEILNRFPVKTPLLYCNITDFYVSSDVSCGCVILAKNSMKCRSDGRCRFILRNGVGWVHSGHGV